MKQGSNETIDIVCGMNLEGLAGAVKSSLRGETFYFCGRDCAQRFEKNPAKFQGEPLIQLKEVYKTFVLGQVQVEVLRGISLRIWPGDFVVILGASGSGKSTVLNMIGLLDRPTSGQVLFRGQDVSQFSEEKRAEFRSKTFGFVFQQYNLIPWLTALENAALPLMFSQKQNRGERGISERFAEIGLADRMAHRPFELSGGEQQRVALLRALANDPEVILGDEPTGNLDSVTGGKILEMLLRLNKEEGKTLVVVTHGADIAAKADQTIVLKDGQVITDHHLHRKMYTE